LEKLRIKVYIKKNKEKEWKQNHSEKLGKYKVKIMVKYQENKGFHALEKKHNRTLKEQYIARFLTINMI
jgi:hypothetical protein